MSTAEFMEELKQLANPYYFVNIVLSFSFLACKLIPPLCDVVFNGERDLEVHQTEILFFMLIIIMVRARKTGSMHFISYLNNAFMYCKAANCILWFFSSKVYGCLYVLAFLLQVLLLPQPTYKGPQKITYFNDVSTFREEVSKTKKGYWLVEFYTLWNSTCIDFASIFAELSNKYHLENLRFGKVDVSRFPDLAKEFRITDSAFSKQLPTLIMFKDGVGINYRPLVESGGKLVKFNFNKENVITTFDLNNIFQECKTTLEEKEKQRKLNKSKNSTDAAKKTN